MAYVVFARKWRPKNFAEIVGQDHIVSILKNSLTQNRLAHAYLFAGPRGIGKTSCARIFAKSLNCVKGPTLKPCEECPPCQEISQGRSMDVIEIDGASNRGIDEIRTLRENVKFSPSSGKYKIYIIDEVHMLTTEAFNALLKTLEEPPNHVKFIFATTQPQKVISTILSRCQRFDFRLMPVVTIIQKLEKISQEEHLKIDKEALFSIAKASGGSMRDAETILDQLSSFSGNKINAQDVTTMLGMVEEEILFKIAESIANKDSVSAICQLDALINSGKDASQFIIDFIEHFRNLMLMRVGGKLIEGILDLPDEVRQKILEQSQKFTLRDILNVIERLIRVQEIARYSDSVRIPLEMILTQLTLSESRNPHNPVLINKHSDTTLVSEAKNRPTVIIKKNETKAPEPAPALENTDAEITVTFEQIKQAWPDALERMSRKKMSVATYLQEGTLDNLDKDKLTISFLPESKFHKEFLERKDNMQLIQDTLQEIFNVHIKVLLAVSTAQKANKDSEEEPFIKSTLETFRGKIIGRWHKSE